jgi:hypothetical protein
MPRLDIAIDKWRTPSDGAGKIHMLNQSRRANILAARLSADALRCLSSHSKLHIGLDCGKL